MKKITWIDLIIVAILGFALGVLTCNYMWNRNLHIWKERILDELMREIAPGEHKVIEI